MQFVIIKMIQSLQNDIKETMKVALSTLALAFAALAVAEALFRLKTGSQQTNLSLLAILFFSCALWFTILVPLLFFSLRLVMCSLACLLCLLRSFCSFVRFCILMIAKLVSAVRVVFSKKAFCCHLIACCVFLLFAKPVSVVRSVLVTAVRVLVSLKHLICTHSSLFPSPDENTENTDNGDIDPMDWEPIHDDPMDWEPTDDVAICQGTEKPEHRVHFKSELDSFCLIKARSEMSEAEFEGRFDRSWWRDRERNSFEQSFEMEHLEVVTEELFFYNSEGKLTHPAHWNRFLKEDVPSLFDGRKDLMSTPNYSTWDEWMDYLQSYKKFYQAYFDCFIHEEDEVEEDQDQEEDEVVEEEDNPVSIASTGDEDAEEKAAAACSVEPPRRSKRRGLEKRTREYLPRKCKEGVSYTKFF